MRWQLVGMEASKSFVEHRVIDDAEDFNYRWSTNDHQNLFTPTCVYEAVDDPAGWCRHTGLSPKGKYKIALIGNSWTANHATLFYQECAYKAKSIMQGVGYGNGTGRKKSDSIVPGCEPFYPTYNLEKCINNFTAFEERVRKEKPDVAFILTR